MICAASYDSPVGEMLLAARDGALTGLWFQGQKHFPAAAETMIPQPDDPALAAAARWLDRYFAGKRPAISDLTLAPAGSAFQKAVWAMLCEIPYGKLTTYGEIARQLAAQRGLPHMSAQAVGGAVGRNPISVIIPCHRVVGASGSLTGYAGGVDVKRRLLLHEGAYAGRLFVPGGRAAP